MKFTKKLIYISLFAILYLIVAFSSLYHAVEFFGLANNMWMAVILAFAFEVGQAAVLFALLTSNKDRGKIMPWVLMTMFTLVQVLGNVYSSYKHIINNSVENLKYFKEPIFIWTQLPDDQATVIITYLVGGLLPISALLLTSMVTNYLNDDQQIIENKEVENNVEKINSEEIHEDDIEKNKDNDLQEIKQNDDESIDLSKEEIQLNKEITEKEFDEFNKDTENIVFKEKDEEIEKLKKEIEDLKNPKINQIPVEEINKTISFSEPEEINDDKEEINDDKEKIPENNLEEAKVTEDIKEQDKDPEKVNLEIPKESHFINL